MKTENNYNDPRSKRTRQFIIDAFISLIIKKDFESITIKDITEKASINRATFYAHFQDKYALFDFVISDRFNEILSQNINLQTEIDDKFMRSLIISVCEYHQSARETCKRGYISVASIMNKKSRDALVDFLYNKFKNYKSANYDSRRIKLLSIMVSNSISSSVYEWTTNNEVISPEILAKEILPFIMGGIHQMLET
jgi:AcrR family transcriptional regulator